MKCYRNKFIEKLLSWHWKMQQKGLWFHGLEHTYIDFERNTNRMQYSSRIQIFYPNKDFLNFYFNRNCLNIESYVELWDGRLCTYMEHILILLLYDFTWIMLRSNFNCIQVQIILCPLMVLVVTTIKYSDILKLQPRMSQKIINLLFSTIYSIILNSVFNIIQ